MTSKQHFVTQRGYLATGAACFEYLICRLCPYSLGPAGGLSPPVTFLRWITSNQQGCLGSGCLMPGSVFLSARAPNQEIIRPRVCTLNCAKPQRSWAGPQRPLPWGREHRARGGMLLLQPLLQLAPLVLKSQVRPRRKSGSR